jgi:hypothetical protein
MIDFDDLSTIDAEVCLRVAHRMELRHSQDREDQLIIFALRSLAAAIRESRED